jgi:hypothetical protein
VAVPVEGDSHLEVSLDLGVVDVEMNRLLVNSGGIAVRQQGNVGAYAGPETSELSREVEPSTWIADDDHQRGRERQASKQTTASTRDLLTGRGHDCLVSARRDRSKH